VPARIHEKSPMNARLVAPPRPSTHSGSIAYIRIDAPPQLAIAIENPPAAPPRQSKYSHPKLASQNAPVTPLVSALANRCDSQGLKVPQNPNLPQKPGVGRHIVNHIPETERRTRTSIPTSSASIVASLLRCFFTSPFPAAPRPCPAARGPNPESEERSWVLSSTSS
jgi:hypothetical protein